MDRFEKIAAEKLPCVCAGEASHFSICPAYYRSVFTIALRAECQRNFKRCAEVAGAHVRCPIGGPGCAQPIESEKPTWTP